MKATSKTAGKTARGCAVWRTITRKGRTILRSSDGKDYCGTPQEVRDTALMPWERDSLAHHLKAVRHIARTRDEMAALAASARRDSVERSLTGAEAVVRIPAELMIQARGAARVLGYDTPKEWIAEAIRTAIEMAKDYCQSNWTGAHEIPMTRHERAALALVIRRYNCHAKEGFALL